MKKHQLKTDDFIKDLSTLGKIYGFNTKQEHCLTKSGGIHADLVWKISKVADPIIIFEVETKKNPNMVQNAMKIFDSKITDVKKPWFFFHIIFNGDAGEYINSLSKVKEYRNYYLFENGSSQNTKLKILSRIQIAILNISKENSFDLIRNRFKKYENKIKDETIRKSIRKQIVQTIKLPESILKMMNQKQITIDQGKKLERIQKIMNASPEKNVSKMMDIFAKQCSNNKWSLEEIDQRLANLKFGYTLDRSKLHQMNLDHEKNIKETGKCFCFELRKKHYQKMGHTEEEIKQIFKETETWSRQDHIHILCTNDNKSENFKLFYRVMFLYGIHHNDLKRLEPTEDELIWMLRKNIKWSTVDKGLCWNCGINTYEVEMNGVWYCRNCAHKIIEESSEDADSEQYKK